MLKRYPLDKTGQSPSNLVKRELHTLDDDVYNRIVVPRMGAFFNDSLIVKQGDKRLTLNKDYLLLFLWQDATVATGLPVSVAIIIKNENLIGDIELQYQVVGGEYQNTVDGLNELLNLIPYDKRKVYWDEVLEKPSAHFPIQHLHHINDVFGLSRLVAVVDDVRRTIERLSVNRLKVVYDRFLKLKQYVENNLDTIYSTRETLTQTILELEQRLQALASMDDLNNTIDAKVSELIDDFRNTDLADLNNKITENKNNIAALRTYTDEELAKLAQSDVTLQNNIDNLKSKYDPKFTEITNKISSVENKIPTEIQKARAEAANSLAGLRTELTEAINTAKTEAINQAQGNVDLIRNEATKIINSKIATVNESILNAKTELNDKIAALKEETDNRYNELKNADNKLTTDINRVQSNLNTLSNNTTNKYNELKNNVDSLTQADVALGDRITVLENKPEPSNELKVDEDELALLVKRAMDRNIAEARDNGTDIELNLIHPDAEVTIDFNSDESQYVYPIKYMTGFEHTEMVRNVFAPATVYEFEKSSSWTIPDIYDGLIAQVYVINAIRGSTLPSGKIVYYPPSTKMAYVMLRGGEVVPITVGNISSFGKYVSNDGIDRKGVITPTYPVIIEPGDFTSADEDIRTYFGKRGKVMIVV